MQGRAQGQSPSGRQENGSARGAGAAGPLSVNAMISGCWTAGRGYPGNRRPGGRAWWELSSARTAADVEAYGAEDAAVERGGDQGDAAARRHDRELVAPATGTSFDLSLTSTQSKWVGTYKYLFCSLRSEEGFS